MKNQIFIAFPAFNEEDIHLTITTALGKAKYPENVHFGIFLHYPKGDFPDLSIYPNVKEVRSINPIGLGTGLSRKIATSLYEDEEYYLQIDAHTIFKTNWDQILIKNYKELKKLFYRPIITGLVPTWSKDENGNILNHFGRQEEVDIPVFSMDFQRDYESIARNIGLPTPTLVEVDYKNFYHEHYLIAANFLFTDAKYLENMPFDPKVKYHEENITAMRAWTKGYRFFSIKEDTMWTRQMFNKIMPQDSWRDMINVQDKNGVTFNDLAVEGLLRNKDILTGKVTGKWGAPSQQDLKEYEKVAQIDYTSLYEYMDEFAKTHETEYTRAKALFDLERKSNDW